MSEETVTDGDTLGAESLEIEIETATDAGESGGPSTDGISTGADKLYTQKELDEQAAKIRRAEERKWQRKYDRELAKARPAEPEVNLEPPKVTDYATQEEFQRAVTRHEIAIDKRQDAIRRNTEATNKEVGKMISEASALAGYDHDAVAPYLVDWGNDDAFAEDLLGSPVRAQLLEYLSLNPDELEKVDEMSASVRRRWLGRMEARFEKKINAPSDQKPKVGGGNVATGYDIKSSNSLEHTRQRAKEGAAWAIRAMAERRT